MLNQNERKAVSHSVRPGFFVSEPMRGDSKKGQPVYLTEPLSSRSKASQTLETDFSVDVAAL